LEGANLVGQDATTRLISAVEAD